METIAEWLAKISWPIVSRVLSALGIGTVTYVGAESALTTALDSAKSAFSGLISEVLQLLAMAGFFDALAITSGGIVSGLSWLVMKRFALNSTGSS